MVDKKGNFCDVKWYEIQISGLMNKALLIQGHTIFFSDF